MFNEYPSNANYTLLAADGKDGKEPMDSVSVEFVPVQELEEAEEALQQVKDELAQASGEIQRLSTAAQERDVAVTAFYGLQTELAGMREENKALRDFKARTMAICAVSHELFPPYTKLAAIVGPEQPTYSASIHGGDEKARITSMQQWNKAICGVETNSNCISRNIERLEETGVLKRSEVETPDKRTTVYSMQWDETLLRHPRFIENDNPRPNNGGNKRCPQCNGFCKKRLTIRYECEKCGIDYDQDMHPISHPSPVEHADVTPSTPPAEPTPIRPSEPPMVCQTPGCNNVRVDRWAYIKLLQQWECKDCGRQQRGRAS